jgi:voltage-gated potassium channel
MQSNDLKSILYISLVTVFTTILGSFAFYTFEFGHNSGIQTIFDSIWWAVVTMTSLGYGDIYPVTTGGRIVAIFLMFFGVLLIGLIAGSFSRHYFEQRRIRKEGK